MIAQTVTLSVIGNRIKNLQPVLLAAGKMAQAFVAENFTTGGSRLGAAWKPLSPRYARRKQKKYGSKPILVRDQQLLNSITATSPRVEQASVTIGANLIYARILHTGGVISRSAGTALIRHRTDAKGNLLRTELFGGKGLIFAGKRHKRVLTRQASVSAYTINIPARPYMLLTEQDAQDIAKTISDYIFKK